MMPMIFFFLNPFIYCCKKTYFSKKKRNKFVHSLSEMWENTEKENSRNKFRFEYVSLIQWSIVPSERRLFKHKC